MEIFKKDMERIKEGIIKTMDTVTKKIGDEISIFKEKIN